MLSQPATVTESMSSTEDDGDSSTPIPTPTATPTPSPTPTAIPTPTPLRLPAVKMRGIWFGVLCFTAIVASVLIAEPTDDDVEIQKVLHAQQDAWNRGDIDVFMNGYWRSDNTVFVSGDDVTRGWQNVLDRYKAKYSDRAKMGTLTFSEIEITALSNDSAVALGSWKLNRANDQPHGRFTLIFRKFIDGWKIVHDHTSAAESR